MKRISVSRVCGAILPALATLAWCTGAASAAGELPSWWGAGDGTTVSMEFPLTDGVNPPGEVGGHPTPDWTGSTWTTTGGVQQYPEGWGIKPPNGGPAEITIRIENIEAKNFTKEVFIQFDYLLVQGGFTRRFGTSPGSTVGDIEHETVDLANGWKQRTYRYTIDPQPAFETFTLRMAALPDYGGMVLFRNFKVGTHCEGEDEDTVGSGQTFDQPDFPPADDFPATPSPAYGGTTWEEPETPSDWIPVLTDHVGVRGLDGGTPENPRSTVLVMTVDNEYVIENVKHVWLQYDYYLGDGASISREITSPEGFKADEKTTETNLGNGWRRVTLTCELFPQPSSETVTWTMDTIGGAVAIDNVTITTDCEPWIENVPADPDPGNGVREEYPMDDDADPPEEESGTPTPPWSDGGTWTPGGDVQRIPGVGYGVTGADKSGTLVYHLDNEYYPFHVKHVWLQYEQHVVQGGFARGVVTSAESIVGAQTSTTEDLADGWTRVTVEFDIDPQPAWEEIQFNIATVDDPSAEVIIRNFKINTECKPRQTPEISQGLGWWFGQEGDDPFGVTPGFDTTAEGIASPILQTSSDVVLFGELEGHDSVLGIPWSFDAAADTGEVTLNLYAVDAPPPDSSELLWLQYEYYGPPMSVTARIETSGELVTPLEYVEEPIDLGWTRVTQLVEIAPRPFISSVVWEIFPDGAPVAIDAVKVDISASQTQLAADMNCDGLINAFDIDPFVVALVNPTLYADMFPGCNIMNADCNFDGAINAFDIDPFVIILVSGGA